jgi:hypothetical protein
MGEIVRSIDTMRSNYDAIIKGIDEILKKLPIASKLLTTLFTKPISFR